MVRIIGVERDKRQIPLKICAEFYGTKDIEMDKTISLNKSRMHVIVGNMHA